MVDKPKLPPPPPKKPGTQGLPTPPKREAGFWESLFKSAQNVVTNVIPETVATGKADKITPYSPELETPAQEDDMWSRPLTDLIDEAEHKLKPKTDAMGVPQKQTTLEKERLRSSLSILNEIAEKYPNADKEFMRDYFTVKYNNMIGKQFKGVRQEVEKEQAESRELMKDVPQSFSDGNLLGALGSAMGQGAAQIPLAVLSGGSSSILMERAAIYNEAVNEKAKVLSEKYGTDISPDDLRALGEDREIEQLAGGFGMISGLLDRLAAGKVLSPLAKGVVKKKIVQEAVKKGVVKRLLNVAGATSTEGATGFIQDVNQQVAVQMSTGKDFDEALTNVDWGRSLDAAAMEAAGGGGVSVVANTISQIDEAINSTPVSPEIAQVQDQTFNDVTKDLPQTPQVPSQPGVSDPVQTGVPMEEVSTTSSRESATTGTPLETTTQSTGDQQTVQPSTEMVQEELQPSQNASTTRITREKTPIESDEYTLLKKQIRDYARGFKQGRTQGMKEGSKEYQDSIRGFGQLVSDFLSGTKRTGQQVQRGTNKDGSPRMVEETLKTDQGVQLSEQQQNAVVKRMTRVSLNNQRSVDSFLNYLGRALGDARYGEKVTDTEALVNRIKSKIKTLPAAIQPEARKFIQTPVEYVNIDDHFDTAQKIVNFISQPGTKKYAPLNLSELSSYNERMGQEVAKQRNAELAEALNTQIGDSEFSPEEVDAILSDEDDPFAANADNARKKQIGDALRKYAEYARIGLDGVQAEGVEGDVLKAMNEIDISTLSPKELKAYIKAVDNAIVNGDFSGSGWIWGRHESDKGAKRIKELKLKSLDIVNNVEGAGSILTPAMMTHGIFGTTERAAQVNKNTGVSETLAGYTRTEERVHALEDEYTKYVDKLKSLHGGDPRSKESTIRRALAAYLVRYKSSPEQELAQRKQDLRESIERTKGYDEETGAMAEKVFKEFESAQSQEEVFETLKKRDIKASKILDFFLNKFSTDIVDDLQTNTEVFYNEPFTKEYNYTPVSLKSIGLSENLEEQRNNVFNPNSPLKPKRAVTTIEASGVIPQNRILDLDFDFNMINRYKQSVYDIETAKHKMQVREFYKNPVADQLFAKNGDLKNKENFYKYYNIVEQDNAGKSPFERDAFTILNKGMALGKRIAYTMLFGDPLKYFSQYAPGAVNSMWNLGVGEFMGARPTQAKKVMSKYPISKRAKRLGGTDFSDQIFNASAFQTLGREHGISGFFDRSEKFLHKISHGVTLGFIKGDVNLAERAWTAAYTKYLRDKGKKIDWKTEHENQSDPLRQEAAAYAEQFVNENMGANQSSQYAKALKASSGGKRFLMDLVFPLSGYPINMKTRIAENVKFIKMGDSKAREDAVKNLFGTISETVLYSALTYFIINSIWGGLKDEITEWAGLDAPENEEEKEKLRQQMFNAQVANDLNPFATGDLLNYAWLSGYNRAAYMMREDEEQLYREWSEENGEPFATFEKTGPTANLGIYSILGRSFEPSTQYMFQVHDDELVTDSNRYPLSPEQLDFIQFNAWVQLFQSFGIGVPFISKQLDAVRREQLKMVKDQKSNASNSQNLPLPPVIPTQY